MLKKVSFLKTLRFSSFSKRV